MTFSFPLFLRKLFDSSKGIVSYKLVETYSESFSFHFNLIANLDLFRSSLFSLYMPPSDVFAQGVPDLNSVPKNSNDRKSIGHIIEASSLAMFRRQGGYF